MRLNLRNLPEPKPTGDPQRDRFNNMTIRELDDVMEGDGPHAEAAREFSEALAGSIRRSLADLASSELLAPSMFGFRRSQQHFLNGLSGAHGITDSSPIRALDLPEPAIPSHELDADEPPLGELATWAQRQVEALNILVDQQAALVENQSALLDLQRRAADDQARESARNFRFTAWNTALAAVAALASVVAIIVTVLLAP